MKKSIIAIVICIAITIFIPINAHAQEIPQACEQIVQARRVCEADMIKAVERSRPDLKETYQKNPTADKMAQLFLKHMKTEGSAKVSEFCISQRIPQVAELNHWATLLQMRGALSKKCHSAVLELANSIEK